MHEALSSNPKPNPTKKGGGWAGAEIQGQARVWLVEVDRQPEGGSEEQPLVLWVHVYF
jgi:hypothetical protein